MPYATITKSEFKDLEDVTAECRKWDSRFVFSMALLVSALFAIGIMIAGGVEIQWWSAWIIAVANVTTSTLVLVSGLKHRQFERKRKALLEALFEQTRAHREAQIGVVRKEGSTP